MLCVEVAWSAQTGPTSFRPALGFREKTWKRHVKWTESVNGGQEQKKTLESVAESSALHEGMYFDPPI